MIHMEYVKDEMPLLTIMGEKILQGFFQATNRGDYSFIPQLYSPTALIHTLEGDKCGPDTIIDIFKTWKFAFPDFQLEPLCLLQESDVLVIHWRGKGTFINPIRDFQPSGKKIAIHGFTCFRCLDNQIIEQWARVDYRPLSQ